MLSANGDNADISAAQVRFKKGLDFAVDVKKKSKDSCWFVPCWNRG